MQTIAVNGAHLSYLAQGQGDPLVFVHGSLGDYRTWQAQMTPFAQHFRVITYSRRYHYPNPWPGDGSDYGALLHAADLAALIRELADGRVHLVASSYGAVVTLHLASRHPQLVRSLTLAEPPLLDWLEHSDQGRTLAAAFFRQALEPAHQAFQRGDREEGVRRFLDGVLGPGAYGSIPAATRASMLDNAREMQAELASPHLFPPLPVEDVARIPAPVLLLTGARSPRLFHLITDELERALPHSQRAQIPDTSHAMHAGNPERYNQTVLDFLPPR